MPIVHSSPITLNSRKKVIEPDSGVFIRGVRGRASITKREEGNAQCFIGAFGVKSAESQVT